MSLIYSCSVTFGNIVMFLIYGVDVGGSELRGTSWGALGDVITSLNTHFIICKTVYNNTLIIVVVGAGENMFWERNIY